MIFRFFKKENITQKFFFPLLFKHKNKEDVTDNEALWRENQSKKNYSKFDLITINFAFPLLVKVFIDMIFFIFGGNYNEKIIMF